jgi:hypothetical protein
MGMPDLLDRLRVASPCPADWAAMRGDDRVRACGQCRRNVYNLTAMTRAEALALIAAREGTIWVRFYRRADGTMMTADCPSGAGTRKLRRVIFAGALAVAACSSSAHQVAAQRVSAGSDAGTTAPQVDARPPAPAAGSGSAWIQGSGSAL